MKFFNIIIVFICLVSCKNEQKDYSQSNFSTSGMTTNAAVTIEMEGEIFTIQQSDLEPNIANIKNDSLLFVLWEDGNPLKLNFNLFNTDILNNSSETYSIPDINSPKVKVDLNVFNSERDAKKMNKRIIFRKGTITISKITDSELHMTFKGEGSGMLEYGKNFPISGKVNISY